MHSPKYSLLLPVRNEAGRIGDVVKAVFADLGARPDWEVCIADDRSDDGTHEKLLELSAVFPFRLLRPDANLGRGPIRNMLARQAQGEILVFLDGDCRPLPGFFAAWESVGAAPDANTVYLGKISYESLPRSGFNRFLSGGSGVYKLRKKDVIPPGYFMSQNFLIPRALFLKAGGFREDLRLWGGEDTDLGFKLHRLSAGLRYQPKAEARHPSVTGIAAYFDRLVAFGRENLPLLGAENRGLAKQFKLPMAAFPYSLLFRNPVVFRFCKFLVLRFPGVNWPFSLYRYVIFNCYARGYKQAAKTGG